MYQTLLYQKEGAISVVQLNRPQKKNAFNAELGHEMESVLKEFAGDPEQRVVIVTGGEEFFCAGADIGGRFKRRTRPRPRTSTPENSSFYSIRSKPFPSR